MEDRTLPAETATIRARMDDGAIIALRRWGAPRAERVVISHGNGLAVDAFARFGAALAARFEVVAFDMRNHGRNHGRNPVTAVEGGNWARFIADIPQILAAIDDAFDPKPAHGAFHSLSSAACLLSTAQTGYPWRSLTVYEPPMPPGPGTPAHAAFARYQLELAARAARRRAQFDSPEQLFASMRRSSLFARVPDADLQRLAAATTRPDGEAWTLCCPPEFEAETFRVEGIERLRPGLARIACPVRVVVGDRAVHPAPILIDVGEALCRDFGWERAVVPGATHFMQLEHPDACAALAGAPGRSPPPDEGDTEREGR